MLSKGALHGHALFLRRLAPSLSLSPYLFTFGAPKGRDLGGIGAGRVTAATKRAGSRRRAGVSWPAVLRLLGRFPPHLSRRPSSAPRML